MKLKQDIVLNYMVKNCLSVYQFSQLTNLHRYTINKLLHNENTTLKTAIKLSKFFNINFRDLIDE